MKKFLKILLSIIIIYNLLPSILGDEPSIFKKAQIYYLAKKYGGVYIFDKALYDEIVFLEKENSIIEEKIKALYDDIVSELEKKQGEIYDEFLKYIEQHQEEVTQECFKSLPLREKYYKKIVSEGKDPLNEPYLGIYQELINDYAYSIINQKIKLKRTLSNGHTYYPHYFGGYRSTWEKGEYMPSEYKKAVIDYIGEKNYNKEKPSIMLDKFYVDKNDKIVPISIFADYFIIKTRYVLNGDEGGGFSFTEKREINISGENYFYINTSKDKNDLLK